MVLFVSANSSSSLRKLFFFPFIKFRPPFSLSLCVSVCLSASLSLCRCLSVCLPLCLCMSVCPPPSLSVSLSFCLYVCPPLSLSQCVSVSVCLPLSLSVSVSVCLSACLSLFPIHSSSFIPSFCSVFSSHAVTYITLPIPTSVAKHTGLCEPVPFARPVTEAVAAGLASLTERCCPTLLAVAPGAVGLWFKPLWH